MRMLIKLLCCGIVKLVYLTCGISFTVRVRKRKIKEALFPRMFSLPVIFHNDWFDCLSNYLWETTHGTKHCSGSKQTTTIANFDCRCYRFTLHHVSDQYFKTGQNGVEMDVLVYQDYSMFYFILVTISKISTEILRKGKKNWATGLCNFRPRAFVSNFPA